jgi:hypothetical protein
VVRMSAEHDRMAEYAKAAAGHPTWSVAYADDVPLLLAEIAALAGAWARSRKVESELALCQAEVKKLRKALEDMGRPS